MTSLFPAFGHLQNQSLRPTPPPLPQLHQVIPIFYIDHFLPYNFKNVYAFALEIVGSMFFKRLI